MSALQRLASMMREQVCAVPFILYTRGLAQALEGVTRFPHGNIAVTIEYSLPWLISSQKSERTEYDTAGLNSH